MRPSPAGGFGLFRADVARRFLQLWTERGRQRDWVRNGKAPRRGVIGGHDRHRGR
jgi:hypothetical protein